VHVVLGHSAAVFIFHGALPQAIYQLFTFTDPLYRVLLLRLLLLLRELRAGHRE
jgi:hypothetical protein